MTAQTNVEASLASAMGFVAVKVVGRTSADLAAAKRGATGVFWLPIEADPFMFVSEEGEIVSLHLQPGRVLRASMSGEYLGVKIGGVTRHVHRMVCETFHGRRTGMVVRHLDGNRLNNRLSNLAWGTHEENAADKIGHGTSNHGERNPQAKLTAALVAEMRRRRSLGHTFKSIAEDFGVAAMTAHRAVTGGSWK